MVQNHEALVKTVQMLNPGRGRSDAEDGIIRALLDSNKRLCESAKLDAELLGITFEEALDSEWHDANLRAVQALTEGEGTITGLMTTAPTRRANARSYDTLDDFDWVDEIESPSELYSAFATTL